MKNLTKRLDELEKIIKSNADSPIWIDGKNNVIRMDVNGKRGKDITFPSTFEAARWLEKRIDDHPQATGNYSVDCICDLYEDSETVKNYIRAFIPDKIIVPDLHPQLEGNQIVYRELSGPANHPWIISVDELSAFLFGHLKTTQPADINSWCLGQLIERYFDTPVFRERFKNDNLSEDDNNFYLALFTIYVWGKRDKATWLEFLRIVHQVARLPDMLQEIASENVIL